MPDLIGYGAHGRDLAAIFARAHPGRILRLYDDDTSKNLPPASNATRHILIGINNPNQRRQVAEKYGNGFGAPKAIVDPSAIIGTDVHLGRGVVIAPLVILLHSVTLGQHCHVNYHASMTRCVVGDYSTISPGATICGSVTIGEECLIGAGAIICDRVKIGDGVIVGAGSVVLPASIIPNGTTVVGVWKSER